MEKGKTACLHILQKSTQKYAVLYLRHLFTVYVLLIFRILQQKKSQGRIFQLPPFLPQHYKKERDGRTESTPSLYPAWFFSERNVPKSDFSLHDPRRQLPRPRLCLFFLSPARPTSLNPNEFSDITNMNSCLIIKMYSILHKNQNINFTVIDFSKQNKISRLLPNIFFVWGAGGGGLYKLPSKALKENL